jgi:hypothetical protein
MSIIIGCRDQLSPTIDYNIKKSETRESQVFILYLPNNYKYKNISTLKKEISDNYGEGVILEWIDVLISNIDKKVLINELKKFEIESKIDRDLK